RAFIIGAPGVQPRSHLLAGQVATGLPVLLPGCQGFPPEALARLFPLDVLPDGLEHDPMTGAAALSREVVDALFQVVVDLAGCCHGSFRYQQVIPIANLAATRPNVQLQRSGKSPERKPGRWLRQSQPGRTRSRNSSGVTISRSKVSRRASRSRSPVTRASASPALARTRNTRSSASRQAGRVGQGSGSSTTSAKGRKSASRSCRSAWVSLNFG